MFENKEQDKSVMNPLASKDDTKPRIADNLNNEHSSLQDIEKELNTKKEQIVIHSMPGKFVPQKNVKKSNSGGAGKRLALIAIILILILAGVIAFAWWYLNKNTEPAPLANNVIVNEEINTNTNDTNVNNDTNNDANTNTNPNDDTNVNNDTNNDANTNTNPNDDSLSVLEDLDSDQDGLSYEEELIFSTSLTSADTDRDGYKDGQEIQNLYDPLVPGQTLEDSGSVTRFINSATGYSFLLPSAWLAEDKYNDSNTILILPDSVTEESFIIVAMDNVTNMTLTEAAENLSAALGQTSNYQNYSLNGQAALRSIEDRGVLVIYNSKIFAITHSVEKNKAINFDSIFEMLLNSFQWLE